MDKKGKEKFEICTNDPKIFKLGSTKQCPKCIYLQQHIMLAHEANKPTHIIVTIINVLQSIISFVLFVCRISYIPVIPKKAGRYEQSWLVLCILINPQWLLLIIIIRMQWCSKYLSNHPRRFPTPNTNETEDNPPKEIA